jgi:cytoskeletal protein RodZ
MQPSPAPEPASARRTHERRAGVSFGEELRREREMRGIDLDEIAAATRVRRSFLEALERDEFAGLPGGPFIRGFIRSYAVHIGADPDRLVNAYLLQISQDREEETLRAHTGPRLRAPEPPSGRRPLRRAGRLLLAAARRGAGLLGWRRPSPGPPA